MNPQQIMDEIRKAQKELSDKNEELRKFGMQKEHAERTYRIELRKKTIRIKRK